MTKIQNINLDKGVTVDEMLTVMQAARLFPDPEALPVAVRDLILQAIYASLQTVKRTNHSLYQDLVDAAMVRAGEENIPIVPDPTQVSVI